MKIIAHPSPNFGPRKDMERPSLVVLHHTAMETSAAALARLCDPGPEVSAHYLVGEDGTVWQLVEETERAWHAGRSFWQGERDINSASIGIELANAAGLNGFPPFPEPQMAALQTLLAEVMARWSIPPEGVLAHSDVAPGRKADPGPKFDWGRLARQGLARATPRPAEGLGFEAAMTRAGYDPEAGDALLEAFRLRWCPQRLGLPMDETDARLAAGLAGS